MEPRLQVLAWHRRRRVLANLSRVELPPVNPPPANQAPANQAPANQAPANQAMGSSLPVNPARVRWKVWNPASPQEKRKLEPGRTKTKEFA